ncbi:MAG: serine--tRNA ligase [Nitrospirota bacterium]
MLDPQLLREDSERVRDAMARRGVTAQWEAWRRRDRERLALVAEVDGLRQERNRRTEEVAARKAKGLPADELMARIRQLGDTLKEREARLRDAEEALQAVALQLPNLPHPSVPAGSGSTDNKEVRVWGAPPTLGFAPRPHWELGEQLGILDFARAATITGSRFALYRGAGALLERALSNFMLDLATREHGYLEVLPPAIVNRASMTGTGQLPKFEEDLFRLRDEDYFLIPTAEVPLTNLHRDELLNEADLPRCYAAWTPCFRREAGSHGKDVRGLIRQHQFHKVELVRVTTPGRSYDELELLTAHAEAVLQRLQLHYRVAELCAGDLGFAAAKTYDLEVWLPSQGEFREISSCSNFEEFQARRCNIRYRPAAVKGNKFVHTLNGSGLATGRTVVAILEQYQQKDGSIVIPEALRPYMHGMEKIEKR